MKRIFHLIVYRFLIWLAAWLDLIGSVVSVITIGTVWPGLAWPVIVFHSKYYLKHIRRDK